MSQKIWQRIENSGGNNDDDSSKEIMKKWKFKCKFKSEFCITGIQYTDFTFPTS